MCGRFVLYRILESLIEHFGVDEILYDIKPSYNIAPSQVIATITKNQAVQLQGASWGLTTPWLSKRIINARSETLLEKFRKPFEKRRCLIPADGYYEWKKGKQRVPYYYQLESRELLCFAGIYEPWKSDSGETNFSCAIITTEANELVQDVHNRMPVILSREKESEWLDKEQNVDYLQHELLQPYPAEEMEVYEVSPAVNSVRNNSHDCIKPVTRRSLLDYL
ncbi:MAG: SOS response-associated peptidase [Candidatus Hodarchaeales archaeon]|jgi:putative SOS response-associated peptidase YedK